jgi:hypothetical protein
MTDDARFEDGAPQAPGTPVLLATDPEDLAVISALVQDALLSADQIRYDRRRRRLALLLNRYCWEPRSDMAQDVPARVRSLLVFGDVRVVRAQGIRQQDRDTILSLLAIEHAATENTATENTAATLTLRLAGDGALRLEVDCIDVVLRDLSAPWPAATGRAPAHGGAAPGS